MCPGDSSRAASASWLDRCCKYGRHWHFEMVATFVSDDGLSYRCPDGLPRAWALCAEGRSCSYRTFSYHLEEFVRSGYGHTCGTCRQDGETKPAISSALVLCSGSLNRKKFGPAGRPTSIEPWAQTAAYTAPKPTARSGASHTENATRPPRFSTRNASCNARSGLGR